MSDESKRAIEAAYFTALALPIGGAATEANTAHRDALNRAHSLRQFEIDNYWKRGTYFWAFQLAAFTLLGFIWRDFANGNLSRNALLLPAGLGAISAIVGVLTAISSKFWQENWEAHVDFLEGAIEGRLTQTVIVKSGVKFSVSRVNERLFILLAVGWIAFFLVAAFKLDEKIPQDWVSWFALCALVLSFMVVSLGTGSKLTGNKFLIESGSWTKLSSPVWKLRLPHRPAIILRHTLSSHQPAPKSKCTGEQAK
ncbi:hypothetical protein [Aquidulcibacter sp.]|uniref:RipA family octameric membrane protein n=1 Tax=Aquidulcibacter sp. TaxID=2052990 RepID=UPI0025BB7EED|nr:hypothetical protein [Aquidulcibacter sp.]MCA3694389.1 hypothetical protein [Aquidulcibacter sp.]